MAKEAWPSISAEDRRTCCYRFEDIHGATVHRIEAVKVINTQPDGRKTSYRTLCGIRWWREEIVLMSPGWPSTCILCIAAEGNHAI